MKIIPIGKPEIVMSNPMSKHKYFGWPTVNRLQNGKIAVVASGFRRRHVCPFGKAVISYSEDEGKTYTMPAPVIDTVLDDRDGATTVIFDEIDTGVSGKTSRKIGIKLKESAKSGTQVLCVTHSAQIASLADNHYRITKREREGRAETDVQLLNADERIDEIARILGSIEPTAAQRNAAREMIEEYQ